MLIASSNAVKYIHVQATVMCLLEGSYCNKTHSDSFKECSKALTQLICLLEVFFYRNKIDVNSVEKCSLQVYTTHSDIPFRAFSGLLSQ
jgi:hypothetical protein